MKGDRVIEAITRGVHATIRPFAWVSAAILCCMALLLTAHIASRFLFRQPLLGTIELVGLMLCAVVWLVVVYAEVSGGHIRVRLLVERFPRSTRAVIGSIVYFVNGIFFLVMGWQVTVLLPPYLAPILRRSEILKIPLFPFIIIIVIGSVLLGIEMLMRAFHPLEAEGERKGE